MTEILASLPYILGAILAITLIDGLGAIASRRFNFSYGNLTVFSLMIYVLLGYYVSGIGRLNMVIIAALFVGFYDATVGWKLSKLLKANLNIPKELEDKITYSHSLMVMIIIAPLFSFIGYAIR